MSIEPVEVTARQGDFEKYHEQSSRIYIIIYDPTDYPDYPVITPNTAEHKALYRVRDMVDRAITESGSDTMGFGYVRKLGAPPSADPYPQDYKRWFISIDPIDYPDVRAKLAEVGIELPEININVERVTHERQVLSSYNKPLGDLNVMKRILEKADDNPGLIANSRLN